MRECTPAEHTWRRLSSFWDHRLLISSREDWTVLSILIRKVDCSVIISVVLNCPRKLPIPRLVIAVSFCIGRHRQLDERKGEERVFGVHPQDACLGAGEAVERESVVEASLSWRVAWWLNCTNNASSHTTCLNAAWFFILFVLIGLNLGEEWAT